MYIALLGLIGSSIDGFLCGFLIKNLGVQMKKRDWVSLFSIIMICCFFASAFGKMLSYSKMERYIDVLGVILMLCLAFSAFQSIYNKAEIKSSLNANILAFSVSADASIVCMYLGLSGYNVYFLAFTSAFLHTILMYFGIKAGDAIIKGSAQIKAKIMAASVFFAIAIFKLFAIITPA